MNIIYQRLFNLGIGHDYYTDQRAKGVTLLPTPATATSLVNSKMLFKKVNNGIVVLYRALDDGLTPMIDLGGDAKFTFYLSADYKNEFLNITDLDESVSRRYESSNIVYFTNDPANASTDAGSPETITHRVIDSLESQLFTYLFSLPAGPPEVLIRVTNALGSLVSVGKSTDGTSLPTTLTLTKSEEDLYSQQIDLRNQPTGLYTITIRDIADANTLREELVYADSELASRDVLGIVDIVYETATDHLYGDTEEYLLQFSRKETIWKYFVVDKNGKIDLVANDLLVTDTGVGGGDPYDTYVFNREGDEPHADIRVNNLDTIIFRSTAPIPFYEEPKLNLELRRNPGNLQVIANLPNPSHSGVTKDDSGSPASEIYVFI